MANNMTTDKPVTSAAQWRAATVDGFPVELPGGNVARLRRTMNLMEMLQSGKIPNPLAGRIRGMMAERKPNIDISGEDAQEMLPQLMELVDLMCTTIFVEPKVEQPPKDWEESANGPWVPSEGAIATTDISIQDKMYAFAFAQGMALDLEGFRQQSAATMATAQNVAAVATDSGVPGVPDGPVPGVLPERGGVDVREPRRASAQRGRSAPRKASTAGSRKKAGSGSRPARPRGDEAQEGQETG